MRSNQLIIKSAALALALTTLAACAGAPALAPAVPFASKATSKTTPAAKAGAKAPHVSYISAETLVELPADAATVNLEFSVRDESAGRQLMQATGGVMASIDRVEFTLTGPGLPEPLVAVVPRAQFLGGKAVIQFNNLPAGAITISAIAKDAAGNKVVEASGGGNVQIGELTKVKLVCVVPPSAGVGHVRIEMDCFSADCLPTPVATPTSFVPDPVIDVNFHSVGDPHEDGANGLKFENQLTAYYMAMRTLTDDFMLVKHQGPAAEGRWPGATVNDAVAIRTNGELFTYYMYGRRMRLNGAGLEVAAQRVYTSPKGATVTCTSVGGGKAVINLVTAQGDRVKIEDQGYYLNLTGSISGERVIHEVRGGLGTFNNGTQQQGLLMRDGTQAPNLAAFLREWIAVGDENIFDAPITPPAATDDAGPALIEVG